MDPIRNISKKREILLERGLIISIPLGIFQRRPLTVLEALVEYLKEKQDLKYAEIACLLNRRPNKVREAYVNAKLKKTEVKTDSVNISVPVSIFADRRLSPFEALVAYLRDKLSLSYHKIASLLKRDDRTIWTVYSRASKKIHQKMGRKKKRGVSHG